MENFNRMFIFYPLRQQDSKQKKRILRDRFKFCVNEKN